jgi:hypothetical protein
VRGTPRLPWAPPMRWWHVALMSGGQVGVSSMRRSCRTLREYSGKHLAPALVRHDKPTRGRAARETAKWGQPTCGVGRSLGSSFRAVFRPGDCQVGPRRVWGVLAVFLASYLLVVGPWIRVLALDWSRVCFFGSMMCHGHMDSCVVARRHVGLCGTTGPNDILCIYLSSKLQSRQMIYPFRSSRRARCNGVDQFGIWGWLWWCHIYAIGSLALNCIIPSAFFMCPTTKARNTNICGNC